MIFDTHFYSFLFGILLAAQIIICISMGGLILIQRSEGGALGMGGGPSGFMSVRGVGNLLTRMTGILAILFFANSIGLTIVGNFEYRGSSIVEGANTNNITAPVTAPITVGASSSSSASAPLPSLSDLPQAVAPTVPSSAQATQPQTAQSQAALPAVVLPKSALAPVRTTLPPPSSARLSLPPVSGGLLPQKPAVHASSIFGSSSTSASKPASSSVSASKPAASSASVSKPASSSASGPAPAPSGSTSATSSAPQ